VVSRTFPTERLWFLPMTDNGYEITVAGNEEQPDLARLAIAQAVSVYLPALMQQVVAYLDASLDYRSLGSSGEWYLEGLQFGANRSHPVELFDVVLTTDEYGDWYDCELWYVTCVFAPKGFEVRSQHGGWYGYHLARRSDKTSDHFPAPHRAND
jgi:hypothetical protein